LGGVGILWFRFCLDYIFVLVHLVFAFFFVAGVCLLLLLDGWTDGSHPIIGPAYLTFPTAPDTIPTRTTDPQLLPLPSSPAAFTVSLNIIDGVLQHGTAQNCIASLDEP